MIRSILRAGLAAASSVGLARREGSDTDFNRQTLRHRSVADVVTSEVPERATPLLDVGCGQGGLARFLHDKGYTQIQGCDWLDAERVEFAPAGLAYTKVDLNLDGLSAFAAGSVGAIVCSDVVEHLENPASILREFARVLEPGGKAIVSLPNAFNWVERVAWLTTGNSTRYKTEKSADEFGHISVVPGDVLVSLAARAGLRVLSSYGGYGYIDGYILLPNRNLSPKFSYNVVWVLQKPN